MNTGVKNTKLMELMDKKDVQNMIFGRRRRNNDDDGERRSFGERFGNLVSGIGGAINRGRELFERADNAINHITDEASRFTDMIETDPNSSNILALWQQVSPGTFDQFQNGVGDMGDRIEDFED